MFVELFGDPLERGSKICARDGRLDRMKQALSAELTEAVWAPSMRVRAATTRKAEWKEIVRGIAELEAIGREHPGHDLVTHKLLNLLTNGLELLLEMPSVVAASKRDALVVAFAAACIARVPRRFPINTPLGSTCVHAWTLGHRTFATHAPSHKTSWRAPLRAIEKAALAFRNAPRTHSEGHLKSATAVKSLMSAGASVPWLEQALEADRRAQQVGEARPAPQARAAKTKPIAKRKSIRKAVSRT